MTTPFWYGCLIGFIFGFELLFILFVSDESIGIIDPKIKITDLVSFIAIPATAYFIGFKMPQQVKLEINKDRSLQSRMETEKSLIIEHMDLCWRAVESMFNAFYQCCIREEKKLAEVAVHSYPKSKIDNHTKDMISKVGDKVNGVVAHNLFALKQLRIGADREVAAKFDNSPYDIEFQKFEICLAAFYKATVEDEKYSRSLSRNDFRSYIEEAQQSYSKVEKEAKNMRVVIARIG